MENLERKLSDLLDDIGCASEVLEKAKYIADQITDYFSIILSRDNEGLVLYHFNSQKTATNILNDYLCKLKEGMEGINETVNKLYKKQPLPEVQHNEKE